MNNYNNPKHGKKVIHVVQHLAPGGIENLALDLLTFANPNDHILLVSLEGTKAQALINWPRLKPFADRLAFLNKPPGVQISLVNTLVKVFKSIKPDVVHTHHIGPLLYAGYAARLASVPVRIHTEHDVWHLESPKHQKLQKLLLKLARPTLVADATQVSKKLAQTFSYKDSVVIKNGVDCQKFKPGSKRLARQEFGLPEEKFIIGCAGRLQAVKGFDNAVNALSMLPQRVELVIAGDGPERESLEALSCKLNLDSRVHFLGRVDDMPRFYHCLDLFLLPSRKEGFPLSPLEAQASNIPAMVSDVGACAEVICPSTGILIRKDSVTDIAGSVMKMLDHKSKKLPREFVVNGHDIRQMVRAYEELATGAIA
ncbi:glycosyltransferase [Vibrio sp. HN007]|uniref:glycosyltransferase n=1 Tax=Vibrio iocasae TaxID=3098914 RepID=UPI0035D49DAC